MIKPTQYIHRVALSCLGESHAIQQIKIDAALDELRLLIEGRLERMEKEIRQQEERATGPDDV